MPISEDEYEHMEASSSNMSKAELRKTHKPIMEKRRRARINQSLNEIKTLILSALNKDPARHSKLEKADILEMAVKHLQNVQRQQLARAIAMDPNVMQKFKAGFNECSDEVNTYINQLDGVESDLKQRLKAHLTGCMSGIEQMAQYNNIAGLLNPTAFLPNVRTEGTIGDQNNNPQMPQGLQLIPSRLPTGEFAFLVPNSSNLPFNFPTINNPNPQVNAQNAGGNGNEQRTSAFASVSSSNQVNNNNNNNRSETNRLPSPPTSPELSQFDDSSRSPSPHGFRPVNPSIHKSFKSAFMATALNKPELMPRNTEFSTALTNLANARNPFTAENSKSETRPIIIQDNRTPEKSRNHVNELNQEELKTIKFPIQPTKKIEPLCIITNQAERYKQAQVVLDSAHCEENLHRGVKRKFADFSSTSSSSSSLNQGLLTVAVDAKASKFLKVNRDLFPSTSKSSTTESAFAIVPPSNLLVRNENLFGSKPGYQREEEIVDLTPELDDEHYANNVHVVPVRDIVEPHAEGNNDMWRPW